MVMLAEPLEKAIQRGAGAGSGGAGEGDPTSRRRARCSITRKVMELAGLERVVLVCGRYEAVDERLVRRSVDEELSIGDYVLSGGELAAMVLIDAVVRQLPGALDDAQSAAQESFVTGCSIARTTRGPRTYAGERVPAVLLSGHHARDRALAAEAGARQDLAQAARPARAAEFERG